MTDAPETLVALIEDAIDAVHDMDVTHRDYALSVADALIASVPDLYFHKKEIPKKCAPGIWEKAKSPFGAYEIHVFSGKGGTFYLRTPDQYRMTEHKYHTTARDAANAHYKAALSKAIGWTE